MPACEYKMVPGLGEMIEGAGLGKQLRDVAVEDLLGRKPVHLDQEGIRARIQGEVILVTGAAGSIGSEICRQIARFNPAALVGFDEAETPLFQIERELRQSFPQIGLSRRDRQHHASRDTAPRDAAPSALQSSFTPPPTSMFR